MGSERREMDVFYPDLLQDLLNCSASSHEPSPQAPKIS